MILMGRIIKSLSGVFDIYSGNKVYVCRGRGKLKLDDKIYVGDLVEFDDAGLSIEKILPRKNKITRPYVANIDLLLAVVAPVPAPDFILFDKLIIEARHSGIDIYLCCNKSDLGSMLDKARKQYTDCVDGIFEVSAVTGEGIEDILEVSRGKLACLCGQSGVGKSSIINTLAEFIIVENSNPSPQTRTTLIKDSEQLLAQCPRNLSLSPKKLMTAVSDISKRIDRGKNTTRHTEIYTIAGAHIIDTPGFGLIEPENIDPAQLSYYFEDMHKLSENCRYPDCRHKNEPDCAVIYAVGEGIFSAERYKRYIKIYDELFSKRQF